jgi:hypothetical protein
MEREDRKASARRSYTDFAAEYFGRTFGDLTAQQRSEALVRFYIESIHNKLRPVIGDDDFERAHVDQPGDLGVDFIHRDDGNVLILQAKYGSAKSRTAVEDIEHFQSVLVRLRDPAFRKSAKLADALAEVDFHNDTFTLQFVTLARIEGQARQQAGRLPEFPEDAPGLDDRVTFEFLAESELNQELRNALSLAEGIPTQPWELVACGRAGKRSAVVEIDAGNHRSFLMAVSAPQIVDLYKRFRDSLFTLNIRNYIGNTRTNKAIVDSALSTPEHFFLYNNGISCLATDVEVGGADDRVTVSGIQVINGAQTVKSLFRASQHERWSAGSDEPRLLVRITEVKTGYAGDRRFREDVTRFNNTQNVIKLSDFRSNDPVQNDLRAKFSRYKRFGRPVAYMPKRTDEKKKQSFEIRLEEFAKVVYSFLCDPVRFSGSTSFLFDDGPDGGYMRVFGDGRDVHDVMPDEDFRLRSAVWWIGREFGEAIRQERKEEADPTTKAALERKWWLIFAARLILEASFGQAGYQSHLRKVYTGDWNLGEGPWGKWFLEIYDKARKSVVYVYTEATSRPGFVHRNWMRNPASVAELQRYVRNALFDKIPPPHRGRA